MDDVHAWITVIAFIAFIGICFWAYSKKRKRDFDEAARLPFTGKDFGDEAADEKREKR